MAKYRPSENWEADWAFAEPMLKAAMAFDPAPSTIAGMQLMLREGRCELWVGEKSAALIELDYNNMLFQIWLAGGDMNELMDALPDVEASARARNFIRVMIYGRKGWEKVLDKIDYQHRWTVLEKSLWVE